MKKRIASCVLTFALCFSLLSPAALAVGRDTSFEESLAADLKSLGIFRGVSDTDFDLARSPTRIEALVMLIRVLGKEHDAISGQWSHPFTDVPAWADKYVGYAYINGLTNGVSGSEFGGGDAGAATYLTFMLRALNYSDSGGADFTWDNPFSLALSVGILPDRVNVTDFWRADVVTISYAALSASLKGSAQTLAQKLIQSAVFTQEQFSLYYDASVLASPSVSEKEMSAQDVYAACSDAVFYIETFDASGRAFAVGSGFFIDESGIAVTNCHVLENAYSATAKLSDGRKCDIVGVLCFDDNVDYAIIKVSGSHFPVLKVGDSKQVSGGEVIYAIGNPLGLTNTISDGIVSNPYREDLDGMIQITAPISRGSSGGALVNVRGEVVGVTTASLSSGQNLNFAVPINSVMPDEDIRTFESVHGIFSMKEFQEFLSYLAAQSNPEASASRQSLAFKALKAFVLQNSNDSVSGDKAYIYTETVSVSRIDQVGVVYNASTDVLTLLCSTAYNGATYHSFLMLTDFESKFYASFSAKNYDAFNGSCEINPASFSEESVFSFSEYTGPAYNLSNYETLAQLMYCKSLEYANYLFSYYVNPAGTYSMADFGFTQF